MAETEQDIFHLFELLFEKFTKLEESFPPMRKKIGKKFSIVQLVGNNKTCNMKDIVENLNLPSSTATRQVDKLVSLDLIKREIPPDNRRMVILSLTDSGQKFYSNYKEHRNLVENKLIKALSDHEKEVLIKILN
ncbi:MAG: MarR family winged helix-turn-helix transcriptional regulator, partial [Promethearchaeota archaeon]